MKCLGKASEVVKDDIPIEYRDNPKVLSVLASYNPKDLKKREESTKKSKQQLYKKLTQGNIEDSVKIYEEYVKIFNSSFFIIQLGASNIKTFWCLKVYILFTRFNIMKLQKRFIRKHKNKDYYKRCVLSKQCEPYCNSQPQKIKVAFQCAYKKIKRENDKKD